jgi:hypothetical protein
MLSVCPCSWCRRCRRFVEIGDCMGYVFFFMNDRSERLKHLSLSNDKDWD